jgi:protein SCO1/2
MTRWIILVSCCGMVWPAAATASNELPPILREVGIDQHLGEQVPLNLPFNDECGRTVSLGDYFDGKPVLLVLAYYRCPMLCTQVLNGLIFGLRGVSFNAGDEFQVVVVSFDERETPDLAAAKKASYVRAYGRPGGERGWHFLTGAQASIDRLTRAVGFRYRYDPKQDQFAHGSGIMLLTAQGTISRYLYGIRFAPTDIRLGLVEASENKIGSPIDQLSLLFCYHYDPSIGQYTMSVLNLVRLGGVVTVVVLGTCLLAAWRRERRRARAELTSVAVVPE